MNHKELISTWKAEESIAYIHGWDFSHISGRYTEQDDLPWDYRAVIGQYLLPDMKILDIDTGGGDGCDCAEILSLIEQGKIDTTPLITHRYKLADVEEAYNLFENKLGGVIKVAVEP